MSFKCQMAMSVCVYIMGSLACCCRDSWLQPERGCREISGWSCGISPHWPSLARQLRVSIQKTFCARPAIVSSDAVCSAAERRFSKLKCKCAQTSQFLMLYCSAAARLCFQCGNSLRPRLAFHSQQSALRTSTVHSWFWCFGKKEEKKKKSFCLHLAHAHSRPFI